MCVCYEWPSCPSDYDSVYSNCSYLLEFFVMITLALLLSGLVCEAITSTVIAVLTCCAMSSLSCGTFIQQQKFKSLLRANSPKAWHELYCSYKSSRIYSLFVWHLWECCLPTIWSFWATCLEHVSHIFVTLHYIVAAPENTGDFNSKQRLHWPANQNNWLFLRSLIHLFVHLFTY